MTTLVIAATEAELSLLAERLQARPEKPILDFPVRRAGGALLVTSGPGMANAAAACAAAIERYGPARVMNVGICGAYGDSVALIGTAVAGAGAVFADTGAAHAGGFESLREMHLPLAQAGGADVYNRIILSNDLIPEEIARADFLTVAAVSGSPGYARQRADRFPPPAGCLLCEDMESAAVALVALRAGLPCTVVRGVSNLCGDRDHDNWDISGAARAAQEILCGVLQP